MPDINLVDRVIKRLEDQAAARRAGGKSLRPRYAPVTEAELAAAEKSLGFPLPPVLRELYLHVGNGGFGPGFGVMGINDNGLLDSVLSYHVVSAYQGYGKPSKNYLPWPAQHVPFCYWGEAIYSVVNCRQAPYPVFMADFANLRPHQPIEKAFFPHNDSLAAWLGQWCEGIDLWKQVYKS